VYNFYESGDRQEVSKIANVNFEFDTNKILNNVKDSLYGSNIEIVCPNCKAKLGAFIPPPNTSDKMMCPYCRAEIEVVSKF
jgi:hypothetical protein